ncbi:Nif3-like dinuclear metal center hexameric protein [Niabella aquatica]
MTLPITNSLLTMNINQIISYLESIAPAALQESYDNAGLLTGQPDWPCTGVLCCLDATEAIVDEAIEKQCNLIVAHHPIIFSGLKKITGKNYVERTIIKAIKNDIAIYAIHTNLDNSLTGVNGKIAEKLGLKKIRILAPKTRQLCKLYFYVPADHSTTVMNALFEAGAGNIGNYSECSFRVNGTGTFRPNEKAHPFTGEIDKRHEDEELKIEILFPSWLEAKITAVLKANHPYEEVAYEVIPLNNQHQQIGAGITGEWEDAITEDRFMQKLKDIFGLPIIKHTLKTGKPVKKVSICGGAGIFLLKDAINSKSDAYITSDIKYHEYFDADGHILLADIGHYESEQFTIELLTNLLEQKFPNFAVLKTGINTNPVHYF